MASPLLNKLLDCAKAIEGGDLNIAESLLKQIKTEISIEANAATRKVVEYFAEALVRRLYKLYPQNPRPLIPSCTDLRSYMDYQFFPFNWFAQLTSYGSIIDALTGKKRVHVIDISPMASFWRWYDVMESLSRQPSGPPSFCLTTIGPQLSRRGKYLQEMGQKLTRNARELRIDFEMRQFMANSASDLVESILRLGRICEEETIVVKWEFELHKLLGLPGAIERVLSKLRELRPEIMVIVEQEANHNGQNFLEWLTQSFQYYSIVFHSLEADTFRDVNHCKVLWEMYFRRQISNILAREGINRIERHETLAQWRKRLFQAGFRPARLWFNHCKGSMFKELPEYRIEEKDRHPVLCRDGYQMLVTSAWKPDLNRSNDGSMDAGTGDLEYMMAGVNIVQDTSLFPLIEETSQMVSCTESHANIAEDPDEMMEGNMWHRECLSINKIAASAEVFDILEYICHVHSLPLALTWISNGDQEGNTNSNGKHILRIESTACYVNDFTMKGFVEACGEGHLEEGQGVAGKALKSYTCFLPDVSMLDEVDDYPFIYDAWDFGLHGVFAIRVANTNISNVDYILEFFLPTEMKEISAQNLLISGIKTIFQKDFVNSWIVCGENSSGANIGSEGRFHEAETLNIIPAAEVRLEDGGTSNVTPAAISSVSLPAFDIDHLQSYPMFSPVADGVEIFDVHEQEVQGQTSCLGEQDRNTDNTFLETPHWARPRKEGTPSSNKTRSKVWIDFEKLIDENGALWAVCKHCKKSYRGESTRGTTNLRKHLGNCSEKKTRNAEQQTPKNQPFPFKVIEADNLEHFKLIDYNFSPSLDETLDRLKTSSRRKQGNSEHQMSKQQAGPFKVIKSMSPEDLKLINYIFDSSLDESDIVVHCNHNHLTRSELCTLRPQTCLDDNVISVMCDALTFAERKKEGSINWYLPICFAEYAYDTSECISFAKKHRIRENYMSALFSCDKMYVPVFDRERNHFYLYVLHMKKQVVEIWDSLAISSGSSVDNRLPNLLAILDILFKDDIQQNYPDGWSFASFSVDRLSNVPQQPNGYDCGVYVIKFMLAPEEATQPDFAFDSDTERLDVVLRLLDGNVNSCRNELAAKAEAYYLRSSEITDYLRIYVREMDEETENKFSML